MASFLLFLIFGTAERTPFAQKSYVRKNPSGIILHLLRVEFCNSQEVQNYSRNPAVFQLQKGPIGLFGGNLSFFTNKEAYWATSIGSNGPFDSNFSGRFDSNFSWKPKKSRKTKKVRGRDRRPLIVFPVFLRDFQNPVWNGSQPKAKV